MQEMKGGRGGEGGGEGREGGMEGKYVFGLTVLKGSACGALLWGL